VTVKKPVERERSGSEIYMRLLFIRHGDPDYQGDCLNEIGLREARALAALIPRMDVGTCYASPLGRSQETAAIALGRAVPGAHGRAAAANSGDILTTLDWLREFPAQVDVNDVPLLQDAYYLKTLPDGSYKKRIVWDMYPSYYVEHPTYSDFEDWRTTLVAHNSDLLPVYDRVISSFDELLAEHGYVRDGRHYRVERENQDTLTFFCHFGITCVLLSHMWNVSPFVPLQSLCMPTSSVTECFSEERQKGYAHFRATRIGDTTHLTMAGLKTERLPHSALFTDVYSDYTQRHD
jgi:probable phosphoglycerate mutase